MKSSFLFLIYSLTTVFILTLSSQSMAITFYVDKNNQQASNENAGSNTAPWLTIQHAADTMAPGDITIVMPGTYDERITVNVSGSPGKLITFDADNSVSCKGFTINGDYIRIQDFEITGDTTNEGVRFDDSSNNCEIVNNNIHHNEHSGIWLSGSNHLIENNDIHDSIYSGDDADGINFFGSGHIIRGNYIHDLYKQGGDPHIDCFQTWSPGASDVIIENNVCKLPTQSGHMQGSNLSGNINNLIFRNNLFINIGTEGINNYLSSSTNGLKIINNTFVMADDSSYAVETPESTNAVVKNNIFHNCRENCVSINNKAIVGENAEYPGSSPYQQDIDNTNCLFLGNGDYHLQENSPCIDRADSNYAPSQDLDGTSRPQGNGVDLGAFEYYGSSLTDNNDLGVPKNLTIIN